VYVASFDGGGTTKTPTVNNNNSVGEKSAAAFCYAGGAKPDGSMEQVFALDYDKLRQNYTIRLWFYWIYFVFLTAIIASISISFTIQDLTDSPGWIVYMLVCFLLFGRSWFSIHRSLSRARNAIHQQHVTLTATGIWYDKHNFPDGSTFHTTIHVRTCCFHHLFLFCFDFCLFFGKLQR
jgi:hypothetical protein